MDGLKGMQPHYGGSEPPDIPGRIRRGRPGSYATSMETVLGNYMERLGSRLNVLETELRYAWRALDMLSQEYVKMWERLEKLEYLLFEQQTVIAQLLEFYTAFDLQRLLLSKTKVGLPGAGGYQQRGIPDEAFYRSLNNAHREEPITTEPTERELSKLWEYERCQRAMETEDARGFNIERHLDSYQNPLAMGQNAQVASNLGTFSQEHRPFTCYDKLTLTKLEDLDVLSSKLLKDSQNLKELRDKLLSSPNVRPQISPANQSFASKLSEQEKIPGPETSKEAESVVDAKLRQIYLDSSIDNWTAESKLSVNSGNPPSNKSSLDYKAMSGTGRPSSSLEDHLYYNRSLLSKSNIQINSNLLGQEALALSDSILWGKSISTAQSNSSNLNLTGSSPSCYNSVERPLASSPYGSPRTRRDGYVPSPKSAISREPFRSQLSALSDRADNLMLNSASLTSSLYSNKKSDRNSNESPSISSKHSPRSPRLIKTSSPIRYLEHDKLDSTSNISHSVEDEISKKERRISSREEIDYISEFSLPSAVSLPTNAISVNISNLLPMEKIGDPLHVRSTTMSDASNLISSFTYISKADPYDGADSSLTMKSPFKLSPLNDPSQYQNVSFNLTTTKLTISPTNLGSKNISTTSSNLLIQSSFSPYQKYETTEDPIINEIKDKLKTNCLYHELYSSSMPSTTHPPPLPAPTSSTYSPYYSGLRSSIASGSAIVSTTLSDTFASNLTTQAMDSKYEANISPHLTALPEGTMLSPRSPYKGEIGMASQACPKFDNRLDDDINKSDNKQGIHADSSDSISSYSSSSSFYPSSSHGSKDGYKYVKHPSSTGPQQMQGAHTVVKYIPLDEQNSPDINRSQMYTQNVQYGDGKTTRNQLKSENISEQQQIHELNRMKQQLEHKNHQLDQSRQYMMQPQIESTRSKHSEQGFKYNRVQNQHRQTQEIRASPLGGYSDPNKGSIHDLRRQQYEVKSSVEHHQLSQERSPIQSGYNKSNVLVSQAGYITITQNVIPQPQEGRKKNEAWVKYEICIEPGDKNYTRFKK